MTTMHDLFAGAGGSSTGAITVPGVTVVVAANHWQRAIDVHHANHPDTRHLCADISQYDPRRIPTAELLWASPECTNHSQAKGRKRTATTPDLFDEILPDEAAERSRATMWDVPRFTEAHEYRAIIVENVVDAYHWPPFKAWLMAMASYGYEHQLVFLNSMHAQRGGLPAPQSRDRMYVVFWRRGERKPDLELMQRPLAWCPECDEVVESIQTWKDQTKRAGRYRAQYVYRCPKHSCRGQIVEPGWLPAAAAIDWSISGQRIGDRTKPLAEKTRARIAAGIARYWRPFTLEAAGNTYERRPGVRTWPADHPLTTLHTTASKALAVPFLTEHRFEYRTRTVDEPMATVAASGNHLGVVAPFIAELRGGGSTARSTDDPLATFTAAGNHHALIMRNNTARGDQGQMTTPAREPFRTLTTAGHQSLLEPGDIEAANAQVDDCLFRMLEPHEVAAGMAFPGDYIWQGNRRERVRMAGNAVTPPTARDLVGAVVAALEGAA